MSPKAHDIVLFGATGFTGALTAEYLARHGGGSRVALAGRSKAKLEALRARLSEINAAWADTPLLLADVEDPDSIRVVAESAKVVISTVGPFILYGEPLVAACAASGTSYVDLTGEPEFVDLMWLRYHAIAQSTGARIVHSCGFDSIPYDLGALYTVGQLPEACPLRIDCFVRAAAKFSGGTYHSGINGIGRLRQTARTASERRRLEARPDDRRVRGLSGPPRHSADAGGWIVPFPSIDPQTVLRSARALERYGPDFSYGHYLAFDRAVAAAGVIAGAGTAIALAQLPPARKLLLKLRSAGDGPTPEQREESWFRVRFVGEGGGERVVTEVGGGDPGYGETSKMLAESALCLAHDGVPERGGQLTPAVAMGQALIDRLQGAGISFAVKHGA